jgi:diacylglycerol kinase (ATP)
MPSPPPHAPDPETEHRSSASGSNRTTDPEFGADLELRIAELEQPPEWTPRAGRRTFREKFGAGLNGLKHAFRGDSSFFAHVYRGLLIALTAALLGVGPWAWCLLVLAAALVFIAELAHSAVDTLARVIGDAEDPRLKVAREIATAGVLVAVTTMFAISITVLTLKFGEQFGWW